MRSRKLPFTQKFRTDFIFKNHRQTLKSKLKNPWEVKRIYTSYVEHV